MSPGPGQNGKHVLIIGIHSGIGKALGDRFQEAGARVLGTHRGPADAKRERRHADTRRLDVTDADSVTAFSRDLKNANYRWDVAVFSVGTLEPIGRFLSAPFPEWERSFAANFFGQLHVARQIRELANPGATAVFFTGGAPNGVLENFSSYGVAKIALTKMVEYLDAEDRDVKYAIVGPGWVNTPIHQQTVKAGDKAGGNWKRTRDFLEKGETGTSMQDIYECICWIVSRSKREVGGRNFSVVWDKWGDREGAGELTRRLAADGNLYKLRRYET